MDSERWKQIDHLLQADLDLPSETREHFLRRACAGDPDLEREVRALAVADRQAGAFLEKMYRANADFVFTVTRDFVRSCQTPVLVLPDDVPAHPYAVALESAHLAPNAQVSIYPWKANPEQIQLALRHVRAFLKANRPASATHQPLAAAAQ